MSADSIDYGVDVVFVIDSTESMGPLIDMVKAVDRHARITDVRVVAKSGGRSGDWREDGA